MSLYTFGVQDMFNASDNLAEHFEFLDQQPKIFPGETSIWCMLMQQRFTWLHRTPRKSVGILVKTQRHVKKEASYIGDWMQVLSMVQFKGVLSLSRYHLHTQPGLSRSFVMNIYERHFVMKTADRGMVTPKSIATAVFPKESLAWPLYGAAAWEDNCSCWCIWIWKEYLCEAWIGQIQI